jgi:hypothetical protein
MFVFIKCFSKGKITYILSTSFDVSDAIFFPSPFGAICNSVLGFFSCPFCNTHIKARIVNKNNDIRFELAISFLHILILPKIVFKLNRT